MVDGSSPLRAGIVGLGHVGAVHVEALSRTPGLSLVACCDRDERLRTVVPQPVPFFTDLDRMLDQVALDVVVIATPKDTHEDLVTRCAAAAVDVILEKPSGGSVAALESISHSFERCGRMLYHALHAEHGLEMALFDSFRRKQTPAGLGPLTSFACVFNDPYVDDAGVVAHAASLGDSWVDSGINALSVLGRVVDLQRLEPINRTSGRLPGGGPTVQSTTQFRILGASPSGDQASPAGLDGLGTINTSWIDGENRKRTWLSFSGSGSEVLLDHSDQSIEIRQSGQAPRRVTSNGSERPRLLNHYLGVFCDYLECRRLGHPNGPAARRILSLLHGKEA